MRRRRTLSAATPYFPFVSPCRHLQPLCSPAATHARATRGRHKVYVLSTGPDQCDADDVYVLTVVRTALVRDLVTEGPARNIYISLCHSRVYANLTHASFRLRPSRLCTYQPCTFNHVNLAISLVWLSSVSSPKLYAEVGQEAEDACSPISAHGRLNLQSQTPTFQP